MIHTMISYSQNTAEAVALFVTTSLMKCNKGNKQNLIHRFLNSNQSFEFSIGPVFNNQGAFVFVKGIYEDLNDAFSFSIYTPDFSRRADEAVRFGVEAPIGTIGIPKRTFACSISAFGFTRHAFDAAGRAFGFPKRAFGFDKRAFASVKRAFGSAKRTFISARRAFDSAKCAFDSAKRASETAKALVFLLKTIQINYLFI